MLKLKVGSLAYITGINDGYEGKELVWILDLPIYEETSEEYGSVMVKFESEFEIVKGKRPFKAWKKEYLNDRG